MLRLSLVSLLCALLASRLAGSFSLLRPLQRWLGCLRRVASRVVLALVAALGGCGLAASTPYRLVINGQVAAQSALNVGSQLYVPVSVLSALGVAVSVQGSTLTLGAPASPSTSPGGANQRPSLEGCLGSTLFNGVWRVSALSVAPISKYNGQLPGYAVKLMWKNGSSVTLDPLNTGVKGVQLILQDGRTLQAENVQDVLYQKLAQGAGNAFILNFYAESSGQPPLTPPDKVLIEIDAGVLRSRSLKAGYTTAQPSMRIDLSCQN